MLISNVVMVGASAGVLGCASSVQSSERSWPKYEDVGKDEQRFTRETWACQIDKFYPDESWAKAACGTAKATRFLLIPMAVSSAIVLVSLWVLVRDRGGLKWLGGGKGRYGGFKSVYELQPTASSAPYAFQAAPQGTPQPFQQWPQQPHHQWAPQPYQQWPQQPYQQWPQQPYQQAPQQPDSQPSQQPASHDQAPDIKTGQQVGTAKPGIVPLSCIAINALDIRESSFNKTVSIRRPIAIINAFLDLCIVISGISLATSPVHGRF
jgi:hypothetical protein